MSLTLAELIDGGPSVWGFDERGIGRAAAAARRYWQQERDGWPLDRTLRVWLMVEAGVDWNPDDPEEMRLFEALRAAVLHPTQGEETLR